MAPIYRVHRAVIFAVAQLSCIDLYCFRCMSPLTQRSPVIQFSDVSTVHIFLYIYLIYQLTNA